MRLANPSDQQFLKYYDTLEILRLSRTPLAMPPPYAATRSQKRLWFRNAGLTVNRKNDADGQWLVMVRNRCGAARDVVLPNEMAAARSIETKAVFLQHLFDGLIGLGFHFSSVQIFARSMSMYLSSSIVSPWVHAPSSAGTVAQNPPSRAGRASAVYCLP